MPKAQSLAQCHYTSSPRRTAGAGTMSPSEPWVPAFESESVAYELKAQEHLWLIAPMHLMLHQPSWH